MCKTKELSKDNTSNESGCEYYDGGYTCYDTLRCCDCGDRDHDGQCCMYCWSCNSCDYCYNEE